MTKNHRPGRDPLDEAVEAFQRMRVPNRPTDDEVLVRLGIDRGNMAGPISTSSSKLPHSTRVLLSSAAALLLICGAGLFALVVNNSAPIAVADVVKAAEKHQLVRYKQRQTTDPSTNVRLQVESTVYADLTGARVRSESRLEEPDGEAIIVSVLDPIRHLVTNSQQRTAWLRRTPAGYKSFCCSLQDFEHHRAVTQVNDMLGDLATVKYRFEDRNETSSLWVDVRTGLPLRMEQEFARPSPDITRSLLVWTDFEWDPALPSEFRGPDDFFSTRPPQEFALEDETENEHQALVPANVVEAWQTAGAKFGWINTGEHASFHAYENGEAQGRELPAFRFDGWHAGSLAKLPQPPRGFGLDLVGTQVTDADLKVLAEFENLQALQLGATRITDAGLKELAPLKRLETLDLANTNLTDAGLKELVPLTSLHALYLGGTRVTDAGLVELAHLESLQSIFLNGTRVTDAGLRALLDLNDLNSLCLSGNAITDAGTSDLAGLKSLQFLYVGGTQLTDAAVNELHKALPSCTIER